MYTYRTRGDQSLCVCVRACTRAWRIVARTAPRESTTSGRPGRRAAGECAFVGAREENGTRARGLASLCA